MRIPHDDEESYYGHENTFIGDNVRSAGIDVHTGGKGIEKKDNARIFERGYGKHTGMGLFFSREVLSITAITISEVGEPGQGARFSIHVPGGKWRPMAK